MADIFDERARLSEEIVKAEQLELAANENSPAVDFVIESNNRSIDDFMAEFVKFKSPNDTVEIKSKLRRFSVRLGDNFAELPELITILREIAARSSLKVIKDFLNLIGNLPIDTISMKSFSEKLLTLNTEDVLKNPHAALINLDQLEVKNWMEAVYYLDLFEKTDASMTEYTAIKAEDLPKNSPIFFHFLVELAKIGRVEILDKYVDVVDLTTRNGLSMMEEMRESWNMLNEGRYVEAELLWEALIKFYGKEVDLEA